ncbi:MAG: pyridoxal-phosphate dependent enzyme [Bacteroidota bacterium]
MQASSLKLFQEAIASGCDAALLSTSRVHRLQAGPEKGPQWWIKREDESGFGISGCKRRKYASLLPWLEQAGYREVALIGGAYSNHLYSFSQLLKERKISSEIFVKRKAISPLKGNALLLSLLHPVETWQEIQVDTWAEAESWVRQQLPAETYVVPEGGSCAPALPGAASLALDIWRNQQASGLAFDHVFIDSGTALTAGALVLGLAWLGISAQVHVVMMAEDEAYFQARMEIFSQWWEAWLGSQPAYQAPSLYHSVIAPAFGKVNQEVLQACRSIAREEGFFVDPVYTGKLLLTARHQAARHELRGNILVVHTGGGPALLGFQDKLALLP